ncbi:MAG: hypothetical protein JSS93_09670 [Bacteroidetes bacterium]|nr:hypothetical protein [Bacteroidota bacterium]
MVASWKEVFHSKRFLIYFFLSLAGLVAFALFLPYFFNFILLPKPGQQLTDPVLNFFIPKDWSVEIFILIYFSAIISIISNLYKPKILLLGLQSYVLVNFMRLTSLYLFTLEAPEGIIPLADPFLSLFAYGQEVYVKDLFFSGHASTLAVLFLIEERRFIKWFIFCASLSMSLFLIWQRVHYSIDIIGAYFFSYIVVRVFRYINRDV